MKIGIKTLPQPQNEAEAMEILQAFGLPQVPDAATLAIWLVQQNNEIAAYKALCSTCRHCASGKGFPECSDCVNGDNYEAETIAEPSHFHECECGTMIIICGEDTVECEDCGITYVIKDDEVFQKLDSGALKPLREHSSSLGLRFRGRAV